MECDFDPLNLYNLHNDAKFPTPLKSGMELSTEDIGFTNNFQDSKWENCTSGTIEINAVSFGQIDPVSITTAKSDGAEDDYDYLLTPLNNSLTTKPSEWQHPTQLPHLSATRNVFSIEDAEDNVELDLEQHDKCRHSRSRPTLLPSSLDDDDDDDGGDDDDGAGVRSTQKVARLKKNRVAASKCREKKKKETTNLQAKERALATERDALKSMAEALREEVIGLKNEVLRHGMCNCSVIHKYIAESARQIVEDG
ncbi:hypothetical protein F5Y11DRAFT_350447 [Daldinia sp. FL1419]|nr:hypothetical protein F5Y11DRAFT_350447 [Daldinia sp. FL1419]